jgi:hypothetical protein
MQKVVGSSPIIRLALTEPFMRTTSAPLRALFSSVVKVWARFVRRGSVTTDPLPRLHYPPMSTNDTPEQELAEIREWFDRRGYELFTHKDAKGWRAAYIPKGSRLKQR